MLARMDKDGDDLWMVKGVVYGGGTVCGGCSWKDVGMVGTQ